MAVEVGGQAVAMALCDSLSLQLACASDKQIVFVGFCVRILARVAIIIARTCDAQETLSRSTAVRKILGAHPSYRVGSA